MAAAPAISTPLTRPRISIRKLEANRRNARRSTGPRTAEGKARVARNAVKHGFFAGIERWSDEDRRALLEILQGLRRELKPTDTAEDACIATIATTSVQLAMMWRYENIAANEYHLRCDRELNDRIANAEPADARRLEAQRETLKAAGLWGPILPDDRAMRAILRYQGSLDRMRTYAYSTLRILRDHKTATGASSTEYKSAKTNPPQAPVRIDPEAAEGPQAPPTSQSKSAKTNPPRAPAKFGPEAAEGPQTPPTSQSKNAKTKPPMAIAT